MMEKKRKGWIREEAKGIFIEVDGLLEDSSICVCFGRP
jgi:hypothetical protein